MPWQIPPMICTVSYSSLLLLPVPPTAPPPPPPATPLLLFLCLSRRHFILSSAAIAGVFLAGRADGWRHCCIRRVIWQRRALLARGRGVVGDLDVPEEELWQARPPPPLPASSDEYDGVVMIER